MDHERTVSVLLLETEAIIAMDVEINLSEAGFRVAGVLSTCSDAVDWLKHETPDVVIIDMRLRDGSCADLATSLHESGIPFIVHSSICWRRGDVRGPFANGLWVLKPCEPAELSRAVNRATTSAIPKRPSPDAAGLGEAA